MASTQSSAPTTKPFSMNVSVWGLDGVGKRSVMERLFLGRIRSERQRVDEYDPTSGGWEYNNLLKEIIVQGQPVQITWDCIPGNHLERDSSWKAYVISQTTKTTDAFLLLYDPNNHESFEALTQLHELMISVWSEEGQHTPKTLVVTATKKDLVEESGPAVKVEEAKAFAHSIGASFTMGSAVSTDGLNETVNEIVRLVKIKRSPPARKVDVPQGGTWSKLLMCFRRDKQQAQRI